MTEQWYSRGYLPHLDSPERIQHVNFHLADSLPQELLRQFEAEISQIPFQEQELERRKRIEHWLDAGYGCCILKRADCANLVQSSLLHFEQIRYQLFEWVIMPNHVHVLFQPLNGWSLRPIVDSWKSFTGRRLAPAMRAAGAWQEERVWHREHWDRYIRDENHFDAVVKYIQNNPVKAGLVSKAADFVFGSAWHRRILQADDTGE